MKQKKNGSIENEFKKLKTLDFGYYIGKSHFEEDGAQNYLVFQSIHRYFKTTNTKYISSRKSKRLSDEPIILFVTSDNSLTPLIDHYGIKIRVKINASSLKQSNTLTYSYGANVNIYIVYELGASGSNDNDPSLKNCLFGEVTFNKKHRYSGYGIGFDRRSAFSFFGGGFGQNFLIFGVDTSSPAHIDNKKKNILVLGKGPTQGLEHTLTAQKINSINFTVVRKKLYLILHYSGANIYLFVNDTDIYKFNAKDSQIVVDPKCL